MQKAGVGFPTDSNARLTSCQTACASLWMPVSSTGMFCIDRPCSTTTVSLFESNEMNPSVTSNECFAPFGSVTTSGPSWMTESTGSWPGRIPSPPA